MATDNYAVTTIGNRSDTCGTFPSLLGRPVWMSLLGSLTNWWSSIKRPSTPYRKSDGSPLSIATQAQRLVPITQFFTWLRREHKIEQNPSD